MFEIKPFNPETYRQQTRRATLIIAVIFVLLAMLLSGLAVMLFGTPGGDNLRLNAAGVFVAVLLMAALMRQVFWKQPWMAAAVYGWQLKRSLMRITNVMHQVTANVQAHDPLAMKLLRFYHLGLTQMHQLDGNSSSHDQMLHEIEQHKSAMEALGLDTEQLGLDLRWLESINKTATR
ncbi:DUF3087 domain-containing protein [Pseudomonas agarici]|uniref:DUF3087 domain-containing protein n=1 Tax=Pseudomonas agarici TaxID=46677 RepID=UPI0015A1A39B|nr:DUF3087 domain-containing protein [Pseudomonas agarici]NWB93067.1 DUF3087 domain-containing protein [Pseudomonas agarici]